MQNHRDARTHAADPPARPPARPHATHTYKRTHACTNARTHKRSHTLHACTHAHEQTHARTYAHACTHTHARTHTHTRTHARTRIHARTNAGTHACTQPARACACHTVRYSGSLWKITVLGILGVLRKSCSSPEGRLRGSRLTCGGLHDAFAQDSRAREGTCSRRSGTCFGSDRMLTAFRIATWRGLPVRPLLGSSARMRRICTRRSGSSRSGLTHTHACTPARTRMRTHARNFNVDIIAFGRVRMRSAAYALHCCDPQLHACRCADSVRCHPLCVTAAYERTRSNAYSGVPWQN
jgi:hypothetical protein